jgi:hypothetical protein
MIANELAELRRRREVAIGRIADEHGGTAEARASILAVVAALERAMRSGLRVGSAGETDHDADVLYRAPTQVRDDAS